MKTASVKAALLVTLTLLFPAFAADRYSPPQGNDEQLRWKYVATSETKTRHWKGVPIVSSQNINVGKDIQDCIDMAMKSRAEIVDDSSSKDDNVAAVSDVYYNKQWSTEIPMLVQVDSVISDHDGASIQALAYCVRNHLGDTMFEKRSFQGTQGGNECTYLAPLLQTYLPSIANKIVNSVQLAWEKAGYEDKINFPEPRHLGIRTSEYLSYQTTTTTTTKNEKEVVALGPHEDTESVYTIVTQLSEPEYYGGGEFFVQSWTGYECHVNITTCRTYFKPPRFSAVVFLSDYTTHGVNPITSGFREVFATEFWRQDDVPMGHTRPSLTMWQDFLLEQRQQQQKEQLLGKNQKDEL